MEEGKVWMWMIPSVRAGRDGRDMGENCEASGKRTTLGKLRGKKTPDEKSACSWLGPCHSLVRERALVAILASGEQLAGF